jgi:YgiT-type zinc finger domain-containing protein
MKCLLCKADTMIDTKSTYFAQLENCYVIIENVPCKKCTQCGEVVYSASVMEKIDDILDRIQNIASKIFIMDYNMAA